MNENYYDNIVNYKLHQQYPDHFTKAEKYSLRRASKKFIVDIAGDDERPLLWYCDKNKKLMVIRGEEEKKKIFMECHSSDYGGHVGRDNTARKIRSRYYWPDYYKDTMSMIEHCDRCQRNSKESKKQGHDVLHPIPVRAQPWYMVGIDLIDAHKITENGNRYVLTQTDYFTKYVEAFPMPEKSALCVAKGLYKSFCRHGAPVHIICDQGREFVNQITEELLNKFNVTQRITSAYHPQSNGLDERTNQTLKKTIRKLLDDNSDNWEQYLDGAVFALNTNVSTTTRYSPFFLMYGRHPIFPFESEKYNKKCDSTTQTSNDETEIAKSIESRMEAFKKIHDEIFPNVSTNISNAQEKQKLQYQKKRGAICPFKEGDLVLKRNMLQKTKKGHKMEDNWLGPYELCEVDEKNGTCRLKSSCTGKILKRKTPMKQLKTYNPSPTQPTSNKPATTVPQASTCNNGSPTSAPYQPPSNKPATTVPQASTCNNGSPTSAPYQPTSKKPATTVPPASTCNNASPTVKSDTKSTKTDPTSAASMARYNEIISKLTGDEIVKIFETAALLHLKNILTGKEKSWRFDVLKCKSFEMKRSDLSWNVHFSCLSQEQEDILSDLLQDHFPHENVECVTKVLLPESIVKIIQSCLDMTEAEAELYAKTSNDESVHNFEEKLREDITKKKRKGTHAFSSTSLPKKKKTNVGISKGLPKKLKSCFTASYPDFVLTPQGSLLVEMIVNGKIKFDGDQTLSADDLKSLSGFHCKDNEEKWLTNFVIESYLKLIKSASAAQGRNIKFFKVEEFQKKGVKVLIKGIGNLLDQDFIFIPLIHANHWTLAVIHPKDKLVLVLDSLASDTIKPITYTRMQKIKSLLQESDPSFKSSDWSFIVNWPDDIPQQINTFDCGVFTCMFARCLATDTPMIKQPGIDAARKIMVLELHQETLADINLHLKSRQIIVPKY